MINKNNTHRISVATILLAFVFTATMVAQEKVGKELQKTFKVADNSKLSIINKYGNIDIKNSNNSTIDVLAQVTYEGISDEKAQELMSMISIENRTEGNNIYFETKYDDNFGQKLNRINNGNKSFEVNYTVNMPHTVSVDLSNKYGNIFVDKISAASKIAVKYGKLKANDISSVNKSPMTEVILGYSDATIEICSWLKLTMKYSKVQVEESKALVVLSKYSKVFVERGSSIVTESKYDTYEIGSIANFVTDAAYSDFRFKSIGKKLHSDTKYSDVKVNYMPAGFENIRITNSYGSYNINIEEGASYKLKGIAKYGSISYPDNSRVNQFKENTSQEVEGRVGSNENPEAKVIIDTKYGAVKL